MQHLQFTLSCPDVQLLLVSGVNRALGLSDELFVLGDSVILTVLGQVRAGRFVCVCEGDMQHRQRVPCIYSYS